ncbi:hypothetical protein NQ315_005510 [Exocentrus adspersus]|uniref:Uncharacterized protein n=1 Tax=Exocentrus adspersus TaxID=1586481 RepID=A0AAV8VSW8_9CUCU|nr:hypothetical protein NQ315_005510 [Exocentrus adspersus]
MHQIVVFIVNIGEASLGSAGKSAPYYMGSTTSLPRGATLLRTYSPAVAAISVDRMKPLPTGKFFPVFL